MQTWDYVQQLGSANSSFVRRRDLSSKILNPWRIASWRAQTMLLLRHLLPRKWHELALLMSQAMRDALPPEISNIACWWSKSSNELWSNYQPSTLMGSSVEANNTSRVSLRHGLMGFDY
jgi:hypothetical protein